MFAYLFEKLSHWMGRTEQSRVEDYLASSSDLAELERRMRSIEQGRYH